MARTAASKTASATVTVAKASARIGETAVRRSAATPLAKERTEFLAAIVGSAGLARMLGVSRSQPTRWRSGAEQPGPDAARGLVDLDHVMTRALMLWPARVATDWLTSANAHLDGARPLDVLKVRGSAEVIDALDAATAGAYA